MIAIPEMINDIAGPSKLKINSLMILGVTVVILFMFAIFGSGKGAMPFTGMITGPQNADMAAEANKPLEQMPESTLTETGKYQLILDVLKLMRLDKKVTKLQFAERVSSIANAVDLLKSKKITEKWLSMRSCLEVGCNNLYYEFLDVIFAEAFKPDQDEGFIQSVFASESKYGFMKDLLQAVINLQKAVDAEDIIETSKAMAKANSLITKIDSVEISDLWGELVNCDLKCPLYETLLIKLTEFKLAHIDE